MQAKFSDLKYARSFAARAIKPMLIILGNDDLYWVVTLAEGQRLIAKGYEAINEKGRIK